MKKNTLLFFLILLLGDTSISTGTINLPQPEWIIIRRVPSSKDNVLNPASNDIWLLLQQPSLIDDQTPLVLILPMLGGINLWAEQRISQRLAERGIASAIMPLAQQFERRYFLDLPSGKLFLERNLNTLGDNLRESIQDIEYVLNRINEHNGVQPQLKWHPPIFGIAGISLGAITASLTMNREKRFKAGAFMLAGAGLGEIITQSALTRRLAKKLGYTTETVKEQLHDLEIIPNAWDNRPVLLAQARWDRVIPDLAQRKLRDLTPQATVVRLPSGHVTAIAHIFWIEDKIADFFQENLK